MTRRIGVCLLARSIGLWRAMTVMSTLDLMEWATGATVRSTTAARLVSRLVAPA